MAVLPDRKRSAHRGLKGLPKGLWQTIENAAAEIAGEIPASPRARLLAISCLALLALVAACQSAAAQAGEWAWMNGSSTIRYLEGGNLSGQPGVYGTLGVPAAGDVPGGRQSPVSWTDSSGHFWLFGGYGFDANGTQGYLNDLWEFNPSTNEWAWIGGSSTVPEYSAQPGVYGTLGVPAAGNIPGGREDAASWTDSSGNFWLFGGDGLDVNGRGGDLNDLWEFNPSTNEWAWMGGSSTAANQPGVYGTLGTPAPGNIAGGRAFAVTWTDSSGRLWLFGGSGYDANGRLGYLNDLWEYSPSTNEWAWMGGSTPLNCTLVYQSELCGEPGVYDTLGTPAAGNIPGGRDSAMSWADSSGNLWLFGGYGSDANGNWGYLNDLWQFNPSTNEWAWMGGSSTIQSGGIPGTNGRRGVYGTLGTPAAGNIPGGRYFGMNWTDGGGRLWLFGGIGYNANGDNPDNGYLNDLWEFNPSTDEWAWMGGSSTAVNQTGVYGTLGAPAAGNIPGGRSRAANWTDSSGNLWLFGGYGDDAEETVGYFLNDLWEYWPHIIFAPLTSPVVYGVPPIHLEATSASGAEVHFRVLSGPGFVHHDRLTITGAGTVVVAAYLKDGPSVTQMIVVEKATPTIRLESWPHSSGHDHDDEVALKARLRGVGNTPTGKVTFFDGETILGESCVNRSGEAEFSAHTLGAGTHSITARYDGDRNYVAITSTPLSITIR